jgi:hypothetical protein
MPTYRPSSNIWNQMNPSGSQAIDLSGILSTQKPMPAQVSGLLAMPQQPQAMPQTPQMIPSEMSTKTFTSTPMSQTPEVQALLSQMRQNRLQSREGQMSGISGLEEAIKNHMANQKSASGIYGMDLSPLMALTDTWTGSRLSPYYKPPTDSKAYLETTARLQDALQRAKGEMTQADMDALKAELGTLYQDKSLQQQSEESKARLEYMKAQAELARGEKSDKQAIRSKENFNKEFGMPVIKMGDFMSSASDVVNILERNGNKVPPVKSNDYALYQSAVSQMTSRYNADVAKLGALAGADLKLLNGATVTTPSMFETWFNERLRGGDASATIQALKAIEKGVDRTVNNYGTLAKKTWGNDVEDLYDSVKSMYFESKAGTTGGGKAPKPKTIEQGGVTYTLNEQTGEYE